MKLSTKWLNLLSLIWISSSSSSSSSYSCPEGWRDAAVVDMGCLLFSEDIMFWTEASQYCHNACPNATMLEILNSEVRRK